MAEFTPKLLRRDEIDIIFEQAHKQLEVRRVKSEIDQAIIAATADIDDTLAASDHEIQAVKRLHTRMVDSVLARAEE